MTVRELIQQLQSCKEQNSDVYINRDFEVDRVTFGSGHTICIESEDLYSHTSDLEDQIENLIEQVNAAENELDRIDGANYYYE